LMMCGSTCFRCFLTHHQELTTALAASSFTIGAWQWQHHDQQRCHRHAPTVKPEAANAVVRS